MDYNRDYEPEDYAEAFSLGSSPERLEMLGFLMEEDQAELNELVEHLESRGYDQPLMALRHLHIPKLEENEVIQYNDQEGTVSYQGHEILEEIIRSNIDNIGI